MSGKEMNDNEWVTYMMLHYIKNNEDRKEIMKDLNINESYFYGRNRKLGIKRSAVIKPAEKTEDKEKEEIKKEDRKNSFRFNFLSGKFSKGKIGLK